MNGTARAEEGYLARRLPGRIDLLDLHRRHPRRYPHLLESVARHPRSARWSLLPAHPRRCGDGAREVLALLSRPWPKARPRDPATAHLPFVGGWLIYLGYELNAALEPTLPRREAPLPEARLDYCPGAILVDQMEGCTWLVAGDDEAGEALLVQMAEDVATSPRDRISPSSFSLGDWQEEPEARFLQGVERVLEYIREGDVFQVNLSRAWRGSTNDLDPADLYARLRVANPAPFAALLSWDDGAVISSSPERLVWSDGRLAETRPIAGTLPREGGMRPDERLLGDPKERAEHVMLIDLERNDLGRVCRPGTVRVDELMTIESYAHVHHIVSNVCGALHVGLTPAELIAAVFPGGTITGCPKIRCMEIIHELEDAARGPYTGSVGYLSRHGVMDLNILIRTFAHYSGQGGRGELELRAGAGIVADSRPSKELAETRAKARGLLRALGVSP